MKWPRWLNDRLQLHNHPADIDKRRGEIDRWQALQQQQASTGWPDEDEAGLGSACRALARAALAGEALAIARAAAVRRAFGPGGARRRDSRYRKRDCRAASGRAVRRPADALAAAQALGDIDEQLSTAPRRTAAAQSSTARGRCSGPERRRGPGRWCWGRGMQRLRQQSQDLIRREQGHGTPRH